MEIPRTETGGYQCPTCEATETSRGLPFVSEGAVRNHHAHAHGKNISKHHVECRHCGDEFETHIDGDPGIYCTRECSQAAMSDGTHPATEAQQKYIRR